ncbi:MAG: Bax inhibitor-1/YccA family protein [Elusimicrobia bacterium]|nr:Bax inhibitor-1/YccA family protein [Elusimicrobiota bacterium]
MIRSGNPALTADTFRSVGYAGGAETMTLQGTVNKTAITLLIAMTAALFTWGRAFAGQPVAPFMLLGGLGGLVVGLVTIFKKTAAPVTAPLYGAFEGLLLGGLSATYEARFPGIVMNAVGLTFGTLFALLLAYKSGLIRPTQNFRLGLAAATGGIFLLYLVNMVLSFFGRSIPFIHQSGPLGIAFSAFVVAIAALNLVLDFDFIERGAESNAPKYMEWYGAFGLVVTLIWLYIEILHLLSKLQSRQR